jgi:hypothetical protein
MQQQFKQFSDNIRLTDNQEQDAKTKYIGVCQKLHDSYYETKYSGKTKLLFGSYKTKTNVRPLSSDQDVDVLFKIPQETFEKFNEYRNNGQSALLQEIKDILKEKYATTDKISAWGKVVLVKFKDGHHNIEVLPAYEKEEGIFLIPNTEDNGYWESFDPRSQLSDFQNSNRISNGLTAELARMIKTWVKNISTLHYKSFTVINDIIFFLQTEFTNGANYNEYHMVIKNFFDHLKRICDNNIQSHVDTAYNRAIKAIEYMDNNKPKEASEKWIKIFGNEFPKVSENPQTAQQTSRVIATTSAPWAK